jgi:DNA-binding protein HU-beta
MTKADIVSEIAAETGMDKVSVVASVDAFMEVVKRRMLAGENIYLRGFGTFLIKKRRRKTARNISRNTTIIIPEHNVPAFKPSKTFLQQVGESVKISPDELSID